MTFTITGRTSDPIRYSIVHAFNTNQQARLNIRGAVGQYDIPSIDMVDVGSNRTGNVTILELKTSGDVGFLYANSMGGVIHIQGDLTGGVLCDDGGVQNTIADMEVDGDVVDDAEAYTVEIIELVEP